LHVTVCLVVELSWPELGPGLRAQACVGDSGRTYGQYALADFAHCFDSFEDVSMWCLDGTLIAGRSRTISIYAVSIAKNATVNLVCTTFRLVVPYNAKNSKPAPATPSSPCATCCIAAAFDVDEGDALDVVLGPVGVAVADTPPAPCPLAVLVTVLGPAVDFPLIVLVITVVRFALLIGAPDEAAVPMLPLLLVVVVPLVAAVELRAAQICGGMAAKAVRDRSAFSRWSRSYPWQMLTREVRSGTCRIFQTGREKVLKLSAMSTVACVVCETAADALDGFLVTRELH
jgi:hypothetical protein